MIRINKLNNAKKRNAVKFFDNFFKKLILRNFFLNLMLSLFFSNYKIYISFKLVKKQLFIIKKVNLTSFEMGNCE